MRRLTRIVALCTVPLALPTGCVGPGRAETAPARDPLATLRTYLAGSFSSAGQAAREPEYFVIDLHMTPMWTWRDDGPWLYVEQAVAATPDRPYRQRVYQLGRAGDGRLWSRVYEFPEPLSHAGAWVSGSPLSELSPGDLEERVGCAITLTWDDQSDSFTGSTAGQGCPSQLNGAAYATSQVVLEADRMLTWDRGYDATGQQVWGATGGGYEFVRVDETAD
jgi:hypothetical protein